MVLPNFIIWQVLKPISPNFYENLVVCYWVFLSSSWPSPGVSPCPASLLLTSQDVWQPAAKVGRNDPPAKHMEKWMVAVHCYNGYRPPLDSVQLVNITQISLWTTYWGESRPTYNWGASHCSHCTSWWAMVNPKKIKKPSEVLLREWWNCVSILLGVEIHYTILVIHWISIVLYGSYSHMVESSHTDVVHHE